MTKTLSVSAIQEGTVIDHIPAGLALTIIQMLQLSAHKHQVTVGLNLKSKRLGLKDIIKIEKWKLTDKQLHDLAVFAPNATLNLIDDYKVKSKLHAHLPQMIENLLSCPNTRCITHQEKVPTRFAVSEFKNKIQLRCTYCEKVFAC